MTHLTDVANTPLSRKRTRSDSSPTFGDFSPLGINDLEALCEMEARFGQASSPLSKKRKCSPAPAPEPSKENKPFTVLPISKPTLDTSHKASLPPQLTPSTSVVKPSEPDFDEYDEEFGTALPSEEEYNSWFQPVVEPTPAFVSFVRPSVGPSTGAPKILQPSAAALKAAEKLLASVEAGENEEETPIPLRTRMETRSLLSKPPRPSTISLPRAEATNKVAVEELLNSTPVALSIPADLTVEAKPIATMKYQMTPHPGPSTEAESVINATPSGKPLSSPPVPESPIVVPKHLGMRARPRGSLKSKFTTPWKQGVQPPTLTPTPPQFHTPRIAPSPREPSISGEGKNVGRKTIIPDANTVFDLNPPPSRKKLCDLPIKKCRSLDALEKFGVALEIGDLEPWNALYWVFEENEVRRDINTAFDALKKAGCSLLTKDWLENHWTLVLWKLANTVVLWPSTQAERWCYQEVLNQLLYRYEREINRCERPAVRLIQERDASPNAAMVLCVFAISWPSGSPAEKVLPGLVLTDGWYKIRAQIDIALARAIKKRKIRVGSKLEIIGARLDAQRKDADEVLKSFNSSSLILSGNSAHLAPWHAKLGFKSRPSAATLNSLVPDGGIVPMMFVTIVNAFPLAFIESREGGERESRDEAEEQAARDDWERKREAEGIRLREEFGKKLETMRGYAERLHDIAGSTTSETSEAPEDVEFLVEELEESEDPKAMLKSISPTTAAHMVPFLNARTIERQEEMSREITLELESSFPVRNVRSCRVLVVKDAVKVKKRSLRTAQVTVWDAEALGKEALVEGKTYMVTNLLPQIPNAWGKPGTEGQVFLVTRRDTKWRKVTTEKR